MTAFWECFQSISDTALPWFYPLWKATKSHNKVFFQLCQKKGHYAKLLGTVCGHYLNSNLSYILYSPTIEMVFDTPSTSLLSCNSCTPWGKLGCLLSCCLSSQTCFIGLRLEIGQASGFHGSWTNFGSVFGFVVLLKNGHLQRNSQIFYSLG